MVEGFVPPKLTNLLNPSVKPNGLPASFTREPKYVNRYFSDLSVKPNGLPALITGKPIHTAPDSTKPYY